MSTSKKRVAILFGGRSTEHQISLLSAKNVVDALDLDKFEPVLIGIDKKGRWHLNEGAMQLMHADDPGKISMLNEANVVLLSQNTNEHQLIKADNFEEAGKIDVVFPVLHGTYGEDGSVQGFAKLANLPCVGCGILGSSIGMDKDVTKRLLRDAGIPVANFVTLRKNYNDTMSYEEIVSKLGKELFIKPANLGSSVGVSFVNDKTSFDKALAHAFKYDPKVVVEEKMTGREVECAVLGNDFPKASSVGEVIPKSSFYTFENKYIDEGGAVLDIPAKLSQQEVERIQELAIQTYRLLECEGMSRVDMFLTPDGELFINEINTIPGFTKISMYPKLWEISGLAYKDLITTLIELAIDSNESRNALIQADTEQ
ncbi:MAG: D-alanine--D-alanine ligase [Saprospiraceae bacterium]|jgi:D-alanine-D-alanine ligase|nr:D-alanine--D-alanine ligase [Saprospiraceae bacterium]MBP9193188.1 D-alanine--D-alanine ligase [Saprospiraceae bacterium]